MLIPRSALAVRKVADTTSSRYALGSVNITRDSDGKPFAVSTDGRRLVAATWQEPNAAEFPATTIDLTPRPGAGVLLPVAAADQIDKCKLGTKSRKKILQYVALQEPADDQQNTVPMLAADGDQTARFDPKQLDGRFPRWMEAVPAPAADDITIALDSALLRGILEAIEKHACTDGYHRVIFSLKAGSPHTNPVTITAASADGNAAIGILMPLSPGDSPHDTAPPKPAWHVHKLPQPAPEDPAAIVDAASVAEPAAVAAIEHKPAPAEVPAEPSQPEPIAPAAAPEPGSGFRDAGSFTPAPVAPAEPRPARKPRQADSPAVAPPAPDWRTNARRVVSAVHV